MADKTRLSMLANAHRRMWDARAAFDDAVVACLLVGVRVEYKHGNHGREVVIVENQRGCRLLVRGPRGEYRIDARRFLP